MDIEKINSREFAKRVVNYNYDPTIQRELQEIHLKLFKVNFRVNCGNCIKQAYVDIRAKLNQSETNQIKKTMSQFEITKGVNGDSKQIHFEHEIFTNDNITDESAKRILKKFTGHIVTFSKYPANWREIVFGKEIKKVFTPVEQKEIEISTANDYENVNADLAISPEPEPVAEKKIIAKSKTKKKKSKR